MFRHLTILAVILLAGTIGACRKGAAPAEGGRPAAETGVHKTFGSGPVKFTVDVPVTSITTADALSLRLTLQAGEGFEAEFPDVQFPDDLPGMILTDYREREEKQGTDRVRIREYELEPEYDGTFQLPAMQVYFHKAGEIKEDMIESEPVELKVAQAPPEAQALALKPVRGLITAAEIEAQRRRVWPWIAAAVVVGAGFVALLVYWMRRPRPVPPPPPAHEVALEALRRLVAKDLIAAGRIEQFFVEITGIVREYIERAFGLRAPEQTTEEFLANITSQPVVAAHRQVLAPFLAAADEVKFARARPEAAAIQRAFDTARDFILQTSGAKGGGA